MFFSAATTAYPNLAWLYSELSSCSANSKAFLKCSFPYSKFLLVVDITANLSDPSIWARWSLVYAAN